jgi:hypothetical protein
MERKTMTNFDFDVTDEGITRTINHYEDARDFVKGIEDGKYYDAFNRLFPTPDMLDCFQYSDYTKYRDLRNRFKSQYGVDASGATLLAALHQCHLTAEPMSRVYSLPSRR